MNTILATFVLALVMALVLGFLLGVFKKLFHVDVDPKECAIRAALPGANCGGCGYPGCDGLAAAIARGDAPSNACTVGGADVAEAVGKITGSAAKGETKVALLLCQGAGHLASAKGEYVGVKTCLAAKVAINGLKRCDFGCIGFGDCAQACPFGALAMGVDGLPKVDYAICTGCGRCVSTCPQKIFSTVSSDRRGAVVLCSNRNQKKAQVIKDCKIGCIKCGKCETVCPKSCIKVTNGIPLVDYATCDSCFECVKGCPTKALAMVENKIAVV
jgi:Na+-translocating ferredoxin:NAD+ oxidoreductase RNF subunit RnfB